MRRGGSHLRNNMQGRKHNVPDNQNKYPKFHEEANVNKAFGTEVCKYPPQLSSLLCDDLEGWEGEAGERLSREGLHTYI